MDGYWHLTQWLQDVIGIIYGLLDGERRVASGECGVEEVREQFLTQREQLLEGEEKASVLLPVRYLRERYGLYSASESGDGAHRLGELIYWFLLLALAMEAEPGLCLSYRQKYGGDMPDFQFGLHLLSLALPVEHEVLSEMCDPESPLWELFERGGGEGYLLQQPLKLRRGVLYYVMTGEFRREPEELFPLGVRGLSLHTEAREGLQRFLDSEETDAAVLYGRRGTGKRTLLEDVCRERNMEGILWILAEAVEWEGRKKEDFYREALFRSRLQGCLLAVSFRGIRREDISWERLRREWRPFVGKMKIIFLAEGQQELSDARRETPLVFALRDYLTGGERRMLTEDRVPPDCRRDWQEELTARYRMNAGELLRSLERIRLRADCGGNGWESRELWQESLRENREDSPLGSLVLTRYRLEDFVGGGECRSQLEIVIRLAGVWRSGLERLGLAGQFPEGLLVLFHGSSGTGKTMSASILANELGMSLVRVDLSRVFDKYIGETEKHLDEIFRSAERNGDILFFDEADALFSKRTQVGDSHDKYANVSTSFLLQRIEAYPGILILATNLLRHFDDAFLRRIRFVVKFMPLDEAQRACLWEKALAGQAQEGISMKSLAAAADFSPARIKAAALVARMLAFSEGGGKPGREQLELAIRMEARKDNTTVISLPYEKEQM